MSTKFPNAFKDATYEQLEILLAMADYISSAHVEYLLEWVDDKIRPVHRDGHIDYMINQIRVLNGR